MISFFFFFNDFGSKLSTNHIIIILVAHNQKPMDIIILQKINQLIYKFLSPPKVTFSKLISYHIYIYITFGLITAHFPISFLLLKN